MDWRKGPCHGTANRDRGADASDVGLCGSKRLDLARRDRPVSPELATLIALAQRHLRWPDSWTDDPPALYWATPLTDAEAAIYADLRGMGTLEMHDLAAFRALKSDALTCLAFLDNATPTNAEAIAALKSTIRIVRALIKHGLA